MMKQIWQLAKRPTIIIELFCVAIGVAVAGCVNSNGLTYALSSGGAASALVALLLDIQNSLASYNQERQIILHFDKMISPIIRRWVEMYIYISDKNRVQSSALANKVNNAKRCGVDLMPNSFNLDDMVNMFDHPFLLQQPLNVPVVKLFAEIDEKLEVEVSRFLLINGLNNFKSIGKIFSALIECKRNHETLQHILGDETLTIGGVKCWDLFKTQAGLLVAQFPPTGNGNPIWNHYYWFMVRIQETRKILIMYENEIEMLRK